jgi:hypothetical protein
MSMRTYLSAISSIEKLRNVVGCKDKELEKFLIENSFGKVNLKKMNASTREDYEEACSAIRAMIDGEIEFEDGSWVHHFDAIGQQQELFLEPELPFSEYGHGAWSIYIEHVEEAVGKKATKLLTYLEQGRPMKASSIECDGSAYAWLTNKEIQLLHEALEQIEVGEDFQGFHDELQASLAQCVKTKCDLYMGSA